MVAVSAGSAGMQCARLPILTNHRGGSGIESAMQARSTPPALDILRGGRQPAGAAGGGMKAWLRRRATAFAQRLRLARHDKPGRIVGDLDGWVVDVSDSPSYRRVRVNGNDYYFRRVGGRVTDTPALHSLRPGQSPAAGRDAGAG